MSGATVSRHAAGACTVIGLAGELDFSAAGAAAEELERLLGDGAQPVVLDLSQTTFLDSAGISLLYELRRATSTRGQELHLAVPEDNLVRRTLLLAGAEGAFRIHPSRAAALASAQTAAR